MAHMYTASVSAVNLPATNAFDVFEVIAPATASVYIHSIVFGQSGTADFGDAQAEGLPIELRRHSGASTPGSGGTTPTARPHISGDTAFGGSVQASNTTVQAAGTIVTIRAEAFNVQAGYLYAPTPEERILLSPSESLIVRIPVGPADAIATTYASVTFEQVGG
jgi:hypothetical protein